MINYELMDFTMKFIKTNPERHDQANWMAGELDEMAGTHIADMNVCGTTGCFAGWASIFAGWHQVRPHHACIDCSKTLTEILNSNSRFCDDGLNHFIDFRQDVVVNAAGEVKSMEQAARESLGLNVNQARAMFDGVNSRKRLEQIVNRLHEDGNVVL